ncbi:retrotransposon protein, putative, ty1-copia subclass [Tanacetum coccineum]
MTGFSSIYVSPLRDDKKIMSLEQPLAATPATNSEANVLLEWNEIYDAYNETIGELHAMLIEYEKGLPKKAETPQVNWERNKQVYIPKPKNPKPSAKEHPTKDDACHHCKEVGHWKRNYPVYLAELLKKKKKVLEKQVKLNKSLSMFYLGNHGVRAQVEAIGSYDLVLPNGLVICLDNCHYAPSILRGVVSVHRLVENGFV